jgi:hypothetical protein
MRSLVAVLIAVLGLVVGQAVAGAGTALFMSGTQSCFPNLSGCRPDSVPSQAEMAATLPSVFAGDDLVGVATPAQFWPLTGLTSRTWNASVARGVAIIRDEVRDTPGQKVVFGVSQSATIVAELKRYYLEHPDDAPNPDCQHADDCLSFVVEGNPNRPGTGIAAQFPTFSLPLIGVTSTGPALETPYDTIDVARQYDPIADFPQHPLNLIATANAIAGFIYLHPNYAGYDLNDVPDANHYTVENSLGGRTDYYLIPTRNLPLLQPLRDLGVPPSIVDPLNAALRPIVEAGYDRNRNRPAGPATEPVSAPAAAVAAPVGADGDNGDDDDAPTVTKPDHGATDLSDGNKSTPGATSPKRRAMVHDPVEAAQKRLRSSVEQLSDTLRRLTRPATKAAAGNSDDATPDATGASADDEKDRDAA